MYGLIVCHVYVCLFMEKTLSRHPLLFSVSSVTEVMRIVNTARLCCGNPDEKYRGLLSVRKGRFIYSSGLLKWATHTSVTSNFINVLCDTYM